MRDSWGFFFKRAVVGKEQKGRFTFEYPDCGWEIIDSSCGSECCGDDGGGRDEIVGEGVVQVALWLENIWSGFDYCM